MSTPRRIAEFAGYRLDYGERALLTPQGTREQLSRRLFATLAWLVEHAGKLVEKQELMEQVWKGAVVEENTLARTISSLRRKLGDQPNDARFIATVSGGGYRFVQAVTFRGDGHEAVDKEPYRLAVLPFEDLSAGGDRRYIGDGFADELIAALSPLDDLRLIARSSAFQLRGADAEFVCQRLRVSHVLTGAVREEGDRIRVSVQLVDARSSQQLWTTQHEGFRDALFPLQEEVSRAVQHGIRQILQIRAPTPARRPIPDALAYEFYLRACSSAQKSGGRAIVETCDLLRQALARDPRFSPAWAMLAMYAPVQVLFGARSRDEVTRDVEIAADQTLAQEPDWWPAHLASASRFTLKRDWLAVERSLKQAQALAVGAPAELSLYLASVYMFVGRIRTALTHCRDTVVADPLSLSASGVYQLALHMVGDEHEAQREYDRSRVLAGDRDMVEHLAIHRLWAQGLAIHDQLRRYLEHQSCRLPVLRAIEPLQDEPERVVTLLMDASRQPGNDAPTPQLMIGWWLAHYGAHDEAMELLWHVYVEREHFHVAWLWFPVLAQIRQSPRFTRLLDSVGIARYWALSGSASEVS